MSEANKSADKSAKATPKTWLQRVVIRLKGGEEADLQKFNEGQKKYLLKQIEIREESVREAEELLEEIQTEFNEYMESPSITSIKTQESRKAYFPEFTKGALYFKKKLETQLDIIESNEEDIEFFQELISKMD